MTRSATTFPFLQHFFGMFDALLADFRNVNQAFNFAFQSGKGAKLCQAGNFSFNQLANLILGNFFCPWIGQKLANGKPDALLFFIDTDYF